jgi:hypothetical protein
MMNIVRSLLSLGLGLTTVVKADSRHLQNTCDLIPKQQEQQVDGTWVFEFQGRPGNVTEGEIEVLGEVFQLFCADSSDGSFYQFSDVTVLNMEDEDEVYAGTEARAFNWAIQMRVATNVLNSENDFFEGERRLKEIVAPNYSSLRRMQAQAQAQGCVCALPTREAFLKNVREMIQFTSEITSIDTVTDMIQTEQVECSPGVDGFSSTFAMDLLGNSNNITEANLEVVANWFRATYNAINTDSCDMFFRRVQNVSVTVLPINETNNGTGVRRLQGITQAPSGRPTASPAPTTTAPPSSSLPPTKTSTEAPSSRGADLFSLLFALDGQCRGCAFDSSLFDEVSTRRVLRELQATELPTAEDQQNQCFCPVGAEIRGPAVGEFLEDWNLHIDAVGASQFPWIQKATDIEAVKAVDCSGANNQFASYLSAGVAGDPSKLTEEDLKAIELKVVETYNFQNQQVCDPLFRVVAGARFVEVIDGVTSEPGAFPSESPSIPSPTTEAGVRDSPGGRKLNENDDTSRQRDLQTESDTPSHTPSHTSSCVPSESSAPSISNAPSISGAPSISRAPSSAPSISCAPSGSPTPQPSQGPVSFSLVFLLDGACKGCRSDSGLFDQISQGRVRKLKEASPRRQTQVQA